ncbi:MAG: potassium-transporting ATPase subunit F [Candidatus Brocadiia bacterium]
MLEVVMAGQIMWLIVSAFIFVYLGYVLIKPENF